MAGRVGALAAVALGTAAVVVASGSETAERTQLRPASAVAWQGLVGGPRAPAAIGQRMLVVLRLPSLADRLAAAGGRASDRQMRRWNAAARSAQRLLISRLGIEGAAIRPEFSYTRVLNGFSAPLDVQAVALLERAKEVEGVYPVRPAYPAAVSSSLLLTPAFAPGMGHRPDVALPGFDGRGVTIALLDTGVDRAQPYLRGRIQDGIDVVGGSELALAAARPDGEAELERHGTQLAGILVGAGGPAGLAGVATGASVLPVRVAGWQQDATGRWAVYARTDQLLAGVERAVDPNEDGNVQDAARIALVGVAEPFAAFASGPLARAAAGALALDTLVVAPAGNDGAAGPGFGSVAGPGGAPAALTVGAADLRRVQLRSRVVLRAGLKVALDRVMPLGGAVAPERSRTFAVGLPKRSHRVALSEDDFFDATGYSRVAGKAALVPGADDPAASARAAARAGAEAVVLYGASLPAGALGIDERVAVPVVAAPASAARDLVSAVRRGATASVSIGPGVAAVNPSARQIAAFSSRGLAFDGGVKPELAAAGVGLATSEPGANEDGSPRFGTVNGSSVAAAVVAGAAALLAQARPALDGPALKALLVGAARPLAGASVPAQGAGLLDMGASAAAEVVADPSALALGRATRRGWESLRKVVVRNVSTRRLVVRVDVERRGFAAAEAEIAVSRRRLTLVAGDTVELTVDARVPEPAAGGPPAEGAIVLRPAGGTAVRVPFAVAFGARRGSLVSEVALSRTRFRPSDTAPTVLTLQAGRVRESGGSNELEPVSRLDIELWTGWGTRLGTIALLRNLLPGRYAFGITGRGPGGKQLTPGRYILVIRASPAGDGPVSRKSVPFRIT